ncbi:hypothetical protein ACHAQH_005405 [Verticillium albo-atrum]
MALEDAVEKLQEKGKAVQKALASAHKHTLSGERKENEAVSQAHSGESDAQARVPPNAMSLEEAETESQLKAQGSAAADADTLNANSLSSVGILRHETIDTPADSNSSAHTGFHGGFNDRDVLRGLHIAASAACDEDVDTWIREKTGVWIRRFLADLKAFEMLGDEPEQEPEHTEQRARQRRTEIRKLKAETRRSRTARQGLV